MNLTITHPAPSSQQTVATSLVADAFGLYNSPEPRVIARDLDIPIEAGLRIAITGPSGSGKSSLLRTIANRLASESAHVIWPDRLAVGDKPVIDAIRLPFVEAIRLLSTCGLSEPRLMLQSPSELSEGERWRFRLALALSRAPAWLALDEFAAALDPILARVLAFNLRRESLRRGCGVLVATCHDAAIGDFDPDVRIVCDHDGSTTVHSRNTGENACSHYTTNSTSPSAPARTGRISRGGITAPKPSVRCDS